MTRVPHTAYTNTVRPTPVKNVLPISYKNIYMYLFTHVYNNYLRLSHIYFNFFLIFYVVFILLFIASSLSFSSFFLSLFSFFYYPHLYYYLLHFHLRNHYPFFQLTQVGQIFSAAKRKRCF